MRIGIIANTFDPQFGEIAGGFVHLFEVAKRWHDDDLVVFAPSVAREVVRSRLPRAAFVALPAFQNVANYQLRYLLRTICSTGHRSQLRSCDALLATSHFFPDVVPALLARHDRLVVCIHHIQPPARERSGRRLRNMISATFQGLSFTLIRSFVPAILVNSSDIAVEIGIDPSRTKTYVMTHGVERDDAAPTGRVSNGSAAVFVGRLVPTKGVDDLLHAWQLVCRVVPEATLTIVGGGERTYVERLRTLAESLGVANSVRFLGRVEDAEKNRALRESAVFVFPSKEEGFGIAVAEAMSSGLPCVVYDLPAYRAFSKGRVTAEVGKVAEFARLTTEVMTSVSLRDRLSKEASDLARSFSWETAAVIERLALSHVAR